MRAAVVGCGVGGMAAAIALTRKGFETAIFEAFAAPRPLGSGLLLQPSGLAALGALGLADQVIAAGSRVERLEGRDRRGQLILDLDYTGWRPDAFGVGIHRSSLFDVLYGALAASEVRPVFGTRIDEIERPTYPVLIDSDGVRHGPFDLVVVADGSGSSLRRSIRPHARAPVYPWGALWADCPDPNGAFDGALHQFYERASIMIGALPTGRSADGGAKSVSLFWSVPVADMNLFRTSDFEAWKTKDCALWPAITPLVETLAGPEVFSPATYRDVSVGRWCEGGCVLIGDAAHGTSPQLGQGANLALIDAVELADRLAHDHRPIARALLTYQAKRRRHVGIYQAASRALTPMFQSHGRFWPWIRDRLFVPLSRAPGMRRISAAVLAGVARVGRWPGRTRV